MQKLQRAAEEREWEVEAAVEKAQLSKSAAVGAVHAAEQVRAVRRSVIERQLQGELAAEEESRQKTEDDKEKKKKAVPRYMVDQKKPEGRTHVHTPDGGTAAAIAQERQARAKEIKEAFTTFDRDSSGTISAHELVEILSNPAGGQPFTVAEAKALIQKFDTNQDGVLEYSEFVKAFGKLSKLRVAGRS